MPTAAMGGSGSGTSLEGFLVVSPDVIERASLLTLAHEIAHQWWADSVFAVGQAPVLLAETMANYGGLRALEGIYGERAAAEARWRGFPGEPPITGGRGYLTLSRVGLDEPLTSATVDGLVAGSKGMLVHDLLSRTLGRERFKTVLRDFARDHAFQDTTWQAFVDAVLGAEPDIGWFLDQWYARSGLPSWTVSWNQQDGQVRGAITQSPPFFRADVEVVLRGATNRELHHLRIEGPRTEFAWRVGYPVAAVDVDPDFKVPHDSPDRTADVDAVAGLGQAVKAARGGADFNAALRKVLREGDFLREAILAGDAFDRGELETARVHVDTALAHRSPLPELLPGLYYTQALLARQRGDRDALERAARAALDADERLAVPSGYALPARELLDALVLVTLPSRAPREPR